MGHLILGNAIRELFESGSGAGGLDRKKFPGCVKTALGDSG
jgi:hypothetical protein